MRLSLLHLLLTASVFGLVVFNGYDHTGYVFDDSFLTFEYIGTCEPGKTEVVDEYVPPSNEVDVYGAFPKSRLLFLSNGLSVGTPVADVVVPEWVFDHMRDSAVVCTDLPVEFLSPNVLKVLSDVSPPMLSPLLEDMEVDWELPPKNLFKKGEVISTLPTVPVISIVDLPVDGVALSLMASVSDFSQVELEWIVDGSRVSSSPLIVLPPGDYDVTLVATDSHGLSSRGSKRVKAKPFLRVVERLKCELGVDCGALAEEPGIEIFKALKTYGLFTFIVEATDTTYPKVSVSISSEKVRGMVEDPSGAEVFVYINGRKGDRLKYGENTITAVGVDAFGNVSVVSRSVTLDEDVRDVLNLRSPFVVGWGR